MKKGQVEMAIVVFFVAALIFLPMVYLFGVEPSSEIRKQASDIEPFMRTTQISSQLSEVYMVSAAEKSVQNSTHDVFGTHESLESLDSIRDRMDTRIARSYGDKVSSLSGGSGCSISGNPEISVEIVSMNSSETCGISVEIENQGEPLTVECQGQSSSYSKLIRAGTEAEVRDLRVFWLRNITGSIMSNESLGGDIREMERYYEESYGSGPCFEDIDVEIAEAEEGYWINTTYSGKKAYTSEGFINQSIRIKHIPD